MKLLTTLKWATPKLWWGDPRWGGGADLIQRLKGPSQTPQLKEPNPPTDPNLHDPARQVWGEGCGVSGSLDPPPSCMLSWHRWRRAENPIPVSGALLCFHAALRGFCLCTCFIPPSGESYSRCMTFFFHIYHCTTRGNLSLALVRMRQ